MGVRTKVDQMSNLVLGPYCKGVPSRDVNPPSNNKWHPLMAQTIYLLSLLLIAASATRSSDDGGAIASHARNTDFRNQMSPNPNPNPNPKQRYLGAVALRFATLMKGSWNHEYGDRRRVLLGGGEPQSKIGIHRRSAEGGVPGDNPVLTAAEVMSGLAPDLVYAVIRSIGRVLCHDTEIHIASDLDGVGRGFDLCKGYSATYKDFDWDGGFHRNGVQHAAFSSMTIMVPASPDDLFGSFIVAEDQSGNVSSLSPSAAELENGLPGLEALRFRWIEWNIFFPVLYPFSDEYISRNITNELFGDNSSTPEKEDTEKQLDQAIQSLETDMSLAINLRIKDGTFDRLLQTMNGAVLGSSVIGEEVHEFVKLIFSETSSLTGDYPYPLQPTPMHTIRVVGIFLLIITCVSVSVLFYLAKHQKHEREGDIQFRDHRKGGLTTDEGLEFMLQGGREEAAASTFFQGVQGVRRKRE